MTDDSTTDDPTTDDPTADDTTPAASYAEATAEIDAILADLERDDADIDLLATRVRRAAELLTWCRERIRVATEDVREAVGTLDDDTGTVEQNGS